MDAVDDINRRFNKLQHNIGMVLNFDHVFTMSVFLEVWNVFPSF